VRVHRHPADRVGRHMRASQGFLVHVWDDCRTRLRNCKRKRLSWSRQ
jgi:hypothetical protein